MNKYRNKKTELYGMVFDSQAEARHWMYLYNLQACGEIFNLQRQTKIDFKINGKKIFTYKPDFEYNDRDGKHHIVDVKGVRTPVFNLKKKIIEAEYGIEIEIVQ